MKFLTPIFQYFAFILLFNIHSFCGYQGYNIIWHITNHAHNSHQSSWDKETLTSTFDTGSNDYSTTMIQLQVQDWNELVSQLRQNPIQLDQFQAAYKELGIDINYVGRLLQEAKPSAQMSHIVNIIELVELASGSGSTNFQKSVAELLVKLEPYLLESFGNIRQSLSWRESWRYDAIIKEFTDRVGQWYALAGGIECARHVLYNSAHTENCQSKLLSKYLSNTEIKQYIEMKKFLAKGDFLKAYSIADSYGSRSNNPSQNYYLKRYQQEFNWKYNFQGIQKEYLKTSYYKKHLTSLPASKVPSEYNQIINNYLENQQKICGHSNSLSSTSERILERIIEIGSENRAAIIEYFCNELSSNNSDPEIVNSFNELSNHFGAPKWLNYNDVVKHMRFDPAIKTAEHTKERKLIAQLGLLNCPNEFGRIQTALNYLDRSCKSDEVSQKLGALGHNLAEDILSATHTQISLLPDFSQSVAPELQPIQDKLIVLFADQFLKTKQNNEDVSPIFIKNICHAYAGMQRGKKVAIVFLQESLLPASCHMALNLEMPFEIYNGLGVKKQVEIGCEQVKARVDACRDIEKNGYIIAQLGEKFSPLERIVLIKLDIDILEAENFVGNQLERVDHHFRMLDLKALAHVHEQKFHPAFAPLIEFVVKSDSLCRLYMDYKQQGPMYAFGTLRSMAAASIKEMYRIDKEIIVGAAQGVWDGVKNVSHMAVHWEQTLTDMAHGVDSLASALDQCLWKINEFAFDIWRHPEKAKKDFTTFYESAIELNQQIRQKIYDKGFADCSRECAKFATETFLAGKLTDFAIAGCNAIEAQTNCLVDKYKGLIQESDSKFLMATDGVEIKVAHNSEGYLFSDANVDSSLSNIRCEQALPKMETYEQARNKALEIIGEVDSTTSKPHIGKIGVCKDKIVGRDWHGQKVTLRLDYDPNKGPHINLTDFRGGKGSKGIELYIPFDGNEALVESLLNHLNDRASLEQAKIIFSNINDEVNLYKVSKAIEGML